MTRKASGRDGELARWLEVEGLTPEVGPGAIANLAQVRALLLEAACERRALSYSELLGALGHRFTRPKMRALCRTLEAIDAASAARGEPELAVLVVREGDGLPGQGWWTSVAHAAAYKGPWTGPEATAFVQARQQVVYAHLAACRNSDG